MWRLRERETQAGGLIRAVLCPLEHPFALRREVLESRAAIDQENAESVFELFDPGRQGRLGDPTDFGGLPEVFFARQREQEFELINHDGRPCRNMRGLRKLEVSGAKDLC